MQTDSKFQGFRGAFSGESLFFIRAFATEGAGTVFYNSYGAIKEVAVEPGKELVVDTGHLVAFTEDVDYSIGKVGGIRSLIAGGEGLVMKFRGNGHVWIQTRNLRLPSRQAGPISPQDEREVEGLLTPTIAEAKLKAILRARVLDCGLGTRWAKERQSPLP